MNMVITGKRHDGIDTSYLFGFSDAELKNVYDWCDYAFGGRYKPSTMETTYIIEDKRLIIFPIQKYYMMFLLRRQ